MDRVFQSFCNRFLLAWQQCYIAICPSLAIIPHIKEQGPKTALFDLSGALSVLNGSTDIIQNFGQVRIKLGGANNNQVTIELNTTPFFDGRKLNDWKKIYVVDNLTAHFVDCDPDGTFTSTINFIMVELYKALEKFVDALMRPINRPYVSLNAQIKKPYKEATIAVSLDHTLALYPSPWQLASSPSLNEERFQNARVNAELVADLNALRLAMDLPLLIQVSRPLEYLNVTLDWLKNCGLKYDKVTFTGYPFSHLIDLRIPLLEKESLIA